MIRLEIPNLRLKSNNEIIRMKTHVRNGYFKKIRKIVATEALASGLADYEPDARRRRVTVTIRHKGTYDKDGRYGAAKPVIDSIIARPAFGRIGRSKVELPQIDGQTVREWGLILDDSPRYIDLEVREEKGDYAVTIEVDDTEPEHCHYCATRQPYARITHNTPAGEQPCSNSVEALMKAERRRIAGLIESIPAECERDLRRELSRLTRRLHDE